MQLGFKEAFKAGISFGKDDMVIPESKWISVNETRDQVKEFERQYMDGLITQGEKYNKVVDAWSKCSDVVADGMMSDISSLRTDDTGAELEPNSVYMMSHSGARGSPVRKEEISDIIPSATTSEHFDHASTTLLYFSPCVIKPSIYCRSNSLT
jgi:DNA-directed RNA polymerase subunit beta'